MVMLRCKYCGAPLDRKSLESSSPYITCASCGTGEYLRPLIDTSAVDVPVAYRPSAGFLRSLSGYAPKRTATGKPAAPQEAEAAAAPPDVLPLLIKAALESGMEKGAFVSECNKISKRADVDMEVAALMILRDRGADVAPFLAGVRASVLGR
ncbi:MAG: DUF2240 family protein [Methanomassiliicoccaceae archaeon]|nr:DUF2240 family protein [Methanomassiliicoccaceae archaeon]